MTSRAVEGEGEGVAPAPGADVEQGVAGRDEGAQGVQGGVALATGVGAEPGGDGGIVVVALGENEAAALDLLAVAAHAVGPGGVRVGGVGAKGVGHGGRVAHPGGPCPMGRSRAPPC